MNHATVRVLLVEDDAVDRLACRRALGAQTDYVFEVMEADTARAGLNRAHAEAPDLILLDYHLPDMDGVEFLAELAGDSGEMPVPVMMLTGADDVGVAVDAMRRGARDYLIKDGKGDYLKLLPTVIHRVLRESQAHADKRAAEDQLRAAEAKYRSLIEQIPAIAYTAALDVPGKLLYVSPQIQRLGYSPDEWLASPDGVLNRVHPEDQARVLEAFAHSHESGVPLRCEYRLLTRNGAPRWFLDEARAVHDAAGASLCLQGVLIDITEDKRREEELEFHRRHLERLVVERTGQLEKQTVMLRSANANLVKEIDERWRAEAAAKRSADEVQDLYDHAPCGYWSHGTDGAIVRINKTALRWLGYTREEVLGRKITDFFTPEGGVTFQKNYPRFKERGEIYDLEFELLRKDGSTLPVQLSATAIRDAAGNFRKGRAALFDISARRQAEEALREAEARFRLLLESAGEGIYGLDTEGRCTFVNDAALAMLGYSRAELLGRDTHSLIQHSRADGSAYPAEACPIYAAFRTGQASQGLVEMLWRKDGSSFPAEYSAQPMREDGQVTGAVLVFRDVTESQALRHLLSYQATHDALTGLVNRQEFERRLERVLVESRSDGEEYALLYLDLDQFKVVNDTCGHTAGDQLLRQITARLHECLRGRDTLARLGGDEFGVLLEHCPLDQALRIATVLRDAAQDYRFVWEGKPFSVSASIGLVPLSTTIGGVSAALAAADAACYAAKEQGRNRVHLYQPDDALLAQQHTQMQWVSRLTHALEANRFRLYQQIIAPLGKHGQGRPHYEILLRLLDEEDRVVEPMAFVPAAERYNLMPAIDRWVIREVISRHAAQQRQAPVAERPIFAVNLSGTSLSDERLAEFVCGLLAEHGVPADMLCFEITETAAIANLSRATEFIRTLKREGCLFALDDFGSGMASFAHLKQLPVDFLKIDGSFIRTMAEDHVTRAMAEAINRVAHVMAIETVAECAESAPVLALLRELGVDHAQGYALARPQQMILPETDALAAGADGVALNAEHRQ
jgi:diguanylate cyclase (GGDEF)-like protein/PAS domain S-box-containing protein